MLGMFGIRIMSENQLLNGYANGITHNTAIDSKGDELYAGD
jgi:hypothetical protein